jgi:DNA-binding response OmpR family regulator
MKDIWERPLVNEKVILVVDDDVQMNELMRIILEERGYSVLSAYDWKTAYKILDESHPDLVLLDLMLPDVNVEETCWKMGKNDKARDIPFIVMTSLNTLPAKLSAFLAGARRFLQKPFSSDELIGEVEKIFAAKDNAPFWRQVAEFQKETDDYIKKNHIEAE